MGFWNNFVNLFSSQQDREMSEDQKLQMQRQLEEAHAKGKLNGYINMHKDLNNIDQHRIATAYGAIYTRVSQIRMQMYADIERVKASYLVNVILDQVAEDALTPDVSTGDILTVSSDNKAIQTEIEFLDRKFNFDRLVQSVTPDMLAYGEYTLRTEVSGDEDEKDGKDKEYGFQEKDKDDKPKGSDKGLLDLHDDVVQHQVVALSKFGDVEGYLVQDDNGKIKRCDPADFVQFSVINRSIRIDLYQQFASGYKNGVHLNKDLLKEVPRYVRVGKSLLYPILGKIKELELLEQLVPATKISKLSNGTIIGVQVPPGYELEKAIKLSQKLEGIINKRISVDTSKDEVSVASILNSAGKIKVVPLFGDKGQTQKMDVRSDEPDDLISSVEDIRKTITASVGVPYEIIFSDDNANKGEMLKRYARYLRILKNVQRSIVQGITQIIMIHLANKDIDFKAEDIQVSFRNKLIEIDSLDRLEFLDSSVQMIDNIKNFVNELAGEDSPYKDAVDLNSLTKFFDKQLSLVGLGDLIDPEVDLSKEEVPAEDVPEEE